MQHTLGDHTLLPIQEKHAWRLCDFVVSNATRLKDYFPKTLEANLTPTLSQYFARKKAREFKNKEEFLFVLKENQHGTITGLFYVKELQKRKGQGELAYCIGYQHEGKGVTSGFLVKVIEWCFETLKLDTLQIIVHENNLASRRIAEKSGFSMQGILKKEHQMANGSWADMLLYELKRPLHSHEIS